MVEEAKTEKTESKSAEKSNWIKMKPAELEKIVLDLAKQGNSPAKIGLILRDQHGVPKAKLIGKRISEILIENKIAIKPEKDSLNEKIEVLNKHIVKHKHDYSAARSHTKKLWALQKL